jgi:hypothetical protein
MTNIFNRFIRGMIVIGFVSIFIDFSRGMNSMAYVAFYAGCLGLMGLIEYRTRGELK